MTRGQSPVHGRCGHGGPASPADAWRGTPLRGRPAEGAIVRKGRAPGTVPVMALVDVALAERRYGESGQKIGITAAATASMRIVSGRPTRAKSVKR
jgi:hypothetical protein